MVEARRSQDGSWVFSSQYQKDGGVVTAVWSIRGADELSGVGGRRKTACVTGEAEGVGLQAGDRLRWSHRKKTIQANKLNYQQRFQIEMLI